MINSRQTHNQSFIDRATARRALSDLLGSLPETAGYHCRPRRFGWICRQPQLLTGNGSLCGPAGAYVISALFRRDCTQRCLIAHNHCQLRAAPRCKRWAQRRLHMYVLACCGGRPPNYRGIGTASSVNCCKLCGHNITSTGERVCERSLLI